MNESLEIFYKVKAIMINSRFDVEDRGMPFICLSDDSRTAYYDPLFHTIYLGADLLYRNVLAHELCHSLQPIIKTLSIDYHDSEGNIIEERYLNCAVEKEARFVELFF